MTPGLAAAVFAMALLFGGLLVERLLLHLRIAPYFRLGIPVRRALTPLVRVPEAREGMTETVAWSQIAEGEAVWWGTSRAAPLGLHGRVRWASAPGGFAVSVLWAPPWTLWVAALWLAGLGIARGEARLTVPIAALMLFGTTVVYWRAGVRAAEELRTSLAATHPE